jgi:hypothetical protein
MPFLSFQWVYEPRPDVNYGMALHFAYALTNQILLSSPSTFRIGRFRIFQITESTIMVKIDNLVKNKRCG